VVLARARDDVRAVLDFSLADAEWDFALAEQPFGEGGEWPPLRLEAAGAPLLLRGKIDRVDLAHDAARTRVIDYKSSRRAADVGTREMGTTAFQVPLYALVAARAQGGEGARGVYLPTPARDLEAGVREVTAERWSELLESAPAAAAQIVGAMREGSLAPVPRDEKACVFCHVRGGCRKPRFAVAPDDERE
jgi:RecB family exonuclease